MKLGKGVGKTTVRIFLCELRGLWSKADPEPSWLTALASRKLRISRREGPRELLNELKDFSGEK